MYFYVESIMHEYGLTEDGEKYIAPVYFVRAELPNGRRFDHAMTFPATETYLDSEGIVHFANIEETSIKRAENLCKKISDYYGANTKARYLNSSAWYETEPRYGSECFVDFLDEPH